MVTKLLKLARQELGEREYPPNSNNIKYNTAYYGKEVSGSNLAWCAVFVWWLFRECGMSELYYGGKKTAYDKRGKHLCLFGCLLTGEHHSAQPASYIGFKLKVRIASYPVNKAVLYIVKKRRVVGREISL